MPKSSGGSYEDQLKAKHASAAAETWALAKAKELRGDAAGQLGGSAGAGLATLTKLLAVPRKRAPNAPKPAAAMPGKQ